MQGRIIGHISFNIFIIFHLSPKRFLTSLQGSSALKKDTEMVSHKE